MEYVVPFLFNALVEEKLFLTRKTYRMGKKKKKNLEHSANSAMSSSNYAFHHETLRKLVYIVCFSLHPQSSCVVVDTVSKCLLKGIV